MDFFKSVFLEDRNQEIPISDPQESNDDEYSYPNSQSNQLNSNPNSASGTWSFGGILKVISTTSESVLETYRRDLKEFGSGLKQETAAFREVAHGSIETVLKSTAEIVSHGKDTFLGLQNNDTDSLDNDNGNDDKNYGDQSSNSNRHRMFSTRVISIQTDSRTYCEEPDDLEDYKKWKNGFVLEDKSVEVEKLMAENGGMKSVYTMVVPSEVDHETFWCRFFYKIHRLEQAEEVRANLVKRAISKEDDEDLRWDDEDDNDNKDNNVNINGPSKADSSESVKVGNNNDINTDDKKDVEEEGSSEKMVSFDGNDSLDNKDCSLDDENLEWDEIDDVTSSDGKKVSGDLNRTDLRKTSSAAEEEELSWDIEEEDEQVKAA